MVRRWNRIFVWMQALYTLVTALWALIDIDSFMEITGPKTDIWLVKTVAVLLIVIGLSLIFAAYTFDTSWPVICLGLLCATGLTIIDFYYTSNGTIRWIYAIDGVIESLFIVNWIIIAFKTRLKEV